MIFRSEIGHILFELRERPGDWRISGNAYSLVHVPTGLTLWIATRGWEALYKPVEAKFTWLDKRRLRRAIASWREAERKRRIALAFETAELVRGQQPHQVDSVQ